MIEAKAPSGFGKPKGALYQKEPNHRNSGSALFAWQQMNTLSKAGSNSTWTWNAILN
jgi:hypothetical protein